MNDSPPEIPRHLTRTLMDWFELHRRTMPWRGETDPYRIWISEIMLQQTQVKTVEAYYLRWMEKFPDLKSFADAPIEVVLRLWEGLGYYSRARNAHHGAQRIVSRLDGRFPETQHDLLSIPGIGPYISAAIASIAFAVPAGVVDGNVIRVMSRLFGIDDLSTTARFRDRIRGIVETSFHTFHPGWVNQAWMEFGALQCTPRPDCERCPFRSICRAFFTHRIDQLPRKPVKLPVPLRTGAIFIVQKSDCVLMVRRPASGLLGGLWELPNIMFDEIAMDSFLETAGLTLSGSFSAMVNHAYSHFKVRFELYHADVSGELRLDDWESCNWVHLRDLGNLAKPKAHIDALRIAGLLTE